MKYFSKNTRFLRKLRGLKLSQIEDTTGIKASTWNNYESSGSHPNLVGFVKIAQFFKVDEYTLLHVDISTDARLIETLKEVYKSGKIIYISSPQNSEVAEPEQSYEHPALITELFQRVIDLETNMAVLKEQVIRKSE